MNIAELEERVRLWHKRHGLPTNLELEDTNIQAMMNIAKGLQLVADSNLDPALEETQVGDWRRYRMFLLLGEVAEHIAALATGDTEELVDSSADILFVLVGTAETYGLPTAEPISEVCDSNDTKRLGYVQDLMKGHKFKGAAYKAPDMDQAIRQGGMRRAAF